MLPFLRAQDCEKTLIRSLAAVRLSASLVAALASHCLHTRGVSSLLGAWFRNENSCTGKTRQTDTYEASASHRAMMLLLGQTRDCDNKLIRSLAVPRRYVSPVPDTQYPCVASMTRARRRVSSWLRSDSDSWATLIQTNTAATCAVPTATPPSSVQR